MAITKADIEWLEGEALGNLLQVAGEFCVGPGEWAEVRKDCDRIEAICAELSKLVSNA